MHKDDYRRKVDSIHVRESLLDEIRAAEQKERVEKATQKPRRMWWISCWKRNFSSCWVNSRFGRTVTLVRFIVPMESGTVTAALFTSRTGR